MTTFADLTMRIDSRDVASGVVKLDDLTEAGRKAETQAKTLASAHDRLAAETRKAGAALDTTVQAANDLQRRVVALKSSYDPLATSIDRANKELAEANALYKAGAISADEYTRATTLLQAKLNGLQVAQAKGITSTKAMSQATLGLSRQFADIGVSAAGGISPLLILIQQGPQIADQLALMKAQGIGASAAFRSMAASAAPLLIALAPLIAVGAAVAGGFALMNRELSKGFPKDVTVGLGLTEEQLERVKGKTVTMGDVWKSTLQVMGKYLMQGPLGDAFKWLAKTWNDTLNFLAKAAFENTALIVGLFLGTYRTIVNNWRSFPAALGGIFVMAYNGIIDETQRFLNAQILAINTALAGMRILNPALRVIPDIAEVDLSRFKGRVNSAANVVGSSFAANFMQAREDAKAGMRQIGKEISDGALKIRQAEILKQAGKPNKATGTDKKEIDEQTEALRAFTDQMERMRDVAAEFERFKPAFINPDLNQAILDADVASAAVDQARLIQDQFAMMGDTIADAFGRGGSALASFADTMTGFRAEEASILAQRAADYATYAKARADFDNKEVKTAQDRFEMMRAELQWDRNRQRSQRDLVAAEDARNVAAIRSAKSLFKEKSTAYKVLTGLEVAYQAIQLAGNIKAIAMDAVLTAKSIAGAFARGAADAAAGAAKMFAMLGPFAFPVVAAMVGVLAALGLRLAGGGGSGPKVPTAEEIQKAQGAGTVLGDSSAKSASIAKSLDIVAANTNRDLEYSNGMLRHLRSIDGQIGALTGLLAKQLQVGGFLSESSIGGLGTKRSLDLPGALLGVGPIGVLLSKVPIIGGIVKSLFGKTKTTTLRDLGIDFDAQSLDAILAGGLSGDAYQTLDVKTKKKFFGITTSNKTKTTTTETPLEQDILTEMTRIIESLRGGVLEAAGALGIEGAGEALRAFTVNLGAISFKDKTGEEIQAELEAVFSKLGDQMAVTALPFIAELQKVGEGAFETLIRVARQYQVIDITLQSIGRTFGAVGIESLALRENLIDLFGSLDEFVEQTKFFAENFLTEAEQIAPIQAAIVKEFQRLGVTGVNTKEEFKRLVLGLDLTTQAGQEMYASLLAIAPAFSKVFEYLTEGAQDVEDARDVLVRAYEREASALEETKSKFDGFADSLKRFRESLDTGPNALLSPEAQYFATQAKFTEVSRKAQLGDAEALGELQSVSQAYLDASKAYYASSGRYFEDLAAVKAAVTASQATAARTASNADQQLSALKASVAGLIKIDEDVISVRDAILNLTALLAAQNSPTTGTPFSPVSPTGQPSYTYTPPAPANDVSSPATGAFNPTTYLSRYGDVSAEYARLSSFAAGMAHLASLGVTTAEDFARYHYDTFGRTEGRTGFATGGSFTVLGSGPKDFGPLTLHGGEVGNVSRKDTMAAVVTELQALRAEVRDLRAQQARATEADVITQRQVGQQTIQALQQNKTAALAAGGRAA